MRGVILYFDLALSHPQAHSVCVPTATLGPTVGVDFFLIHENFFLYVETRVNPWSPCTPIPWTGYFWVTLYPLYLYPHWVGGQALGPTPSPPCWGSGTFFVIVKTFCYWHFYVFSKTFFLIGEMLFSYRCKLLYMHLFFLLVSFQFVNGFLLWSLCVPMCTQWGCMRHCWALHPLDYWPAFLCDTHQTFVHCGP